MRRWLFSLTVAAIGSLIIAACGGTEVVEVIKEVPVRDQVIKEVVTEVEVPVEKVVVKEVRVVETVVVEKEVAKEVERVVVKEVPKEVVEGSGGKGGGDGGGRGREGGGEREDSGGDAGQHRGDGDRGGQVRRHPSDACPSRVSSLWTLSLRQRTLPGPSPEGISSRLCSPRVLTSAPIRCW